MKAVLVGVGLTQLVFSQPTSPRDASSAAASGDEWEFSVAVLTYIVPHETNYVSPSFSADRTWLHLEARYNYEDRRTGSVWIGYNFRLGNNVVFEITPLAGGVFGRTNGVAFGANASLTYKKIEISTESEYVINPVDRTANFFYTWSELGYSPLKSLRVGLVGQRTRAYQTPLDVQRGFFVGISHKRLDFTTYIFNPGWADPTVVLAATFSF